MFGIRKKTAERQREIDERIAQIDADFNRKMDELNEKFKLENSIFDKMVTALNRGETEEAHRLYEELRILEEG